MSGRQTNGEHGLDAAVELQELLDTWGGEAERWPEAARVRIEALLVSTPGARAVLAEARALDRLIGQVRDAPARMPALAQNGLTDRIVAAALAQAALAQTALALPPAVRGGSVVQFPGGRRLAAAAQAARTEVALPPRHLWRATAVMAASLVMGIVLGGNLNLAPVMQELVEVAGLSAVVDPAVADDLGEEDTP